MRVRRTVLGAAALTSVIALLPSRQQSAEFNHTEGQTDLIPAAFARASDSGPPEFDCAGDVGVSGLPPSPYAQELERGQSIEGVIVGRRGDDIFIQRIKCKGDTWSLTRVLTFGVVGGDCKERNSGNRRLVRAPFREESISMKCCGNTKTIIQVTKL